MATHVALETQCDGGAVGVGRGFGSGLVGHLRRLGLGGWLGGWCTGFMIWLRQLANTCRLLDVLELLDSLLKFE